MWLSLWNQTASAHSLIQGSSFHDAFNQRSLSHGVVKNYKLQQLQESFSTKKSKLLAVYTRKKRKKESTNAGALAWAAALREKLRWGAHRFGLGFLPLLGTRTRLVVGRQRFFRWATNWREQKNHLGWAGPEYGSGQGPSCIFNKERHCFLKDWFTFFCTPKWAKNLLFYAQF
jgi:hypothetical protein